MNNEQSEMFSTSSPLQARQFALRAATAEAQASNLKNVTKFACASASLSKRSLLCHPAQLAAAVLGQRCEAHIQDDCRK